MSFFIIHLFLFTINELKPFDHLTFYFYCLSESSNVKSEWLIW